MLIKENNKGEERRKAHNSLFNCQKLAKIIYLLASNFFLFAFLWLEPNHEENENLLKAFARNQPRMRSQNLLLLKWQGRQNGESLVGTVGSGWEGIPAFCAMSWSSLSSKSLCV
jgi:hypothetical protein